MSERRKQIIQELSLLQDWCTGTTLAQKFGVSSRTIRSDIERINQENPQTILSNKQKGYRLNQDRDDNGKNTSDVKEHYRRLVLMVKALCDGGFYIDDWVNKLFISHSTVASDLLKIKKIIQTYPDLEIQRTEGFLSLKGTEFSKRKLYKNLLATEFEEEFIDVEKLVALYPDIDMNRVITIFEQLLSEKKFSVRPLSLPMLYVHVGIILERIIHQQFLVSPLDLDFSSEEENLARTFFERISVHAPEYEVQAFAALLTTYRSDYRFSSSRHHFSKKYAIEELMKIFIDRCSSYSGIDFFKDQELVNGLRLHFHGLFIRLEMQSTISNPFVDELKHQFPLIFDLTVYGMAGIQECIRSSIEESEIGFIALHMGASYSRLAKKHKKRMLLVTTLNTNLSKMIEEKINRLFSTRLELVKVSPYWSETFIEEFDLDLVVSTGRMQARSGLPWVSISGFMTEKDEQAIFMVLQKIEQQHLETAFSIQIEQFISNQFFYPALVAENPREAIRLMVTPLQNCGVVDSSYLESVWERENYSPTSFQYGLAIPHAMNESCRESMISIAFLKKPIRWGNYHVKMIFLLSLADKDKRFLPIFFDWIGRMTEKPETLHQLLSAKSYEEFIQQIVR